MKNNKGFTLTELLATVVILGLLMGIAIPAVNHYLLKSKTQSLETMGKTAAEAAHSKAVGDTAFAPGVEYTLHDLHLDGFMDKPIDPNNPKSECTGKVKVQIAEQEAGATSDTLDNYTYDVTINCASSGKSLHKKYDTEGNEITN